MAKNYFYNLLLTLTNLLFPILSFPYVSRILGPEGIGKAQFAFSLAQYIGLIASIGIPIYGIKEIARHKNDIEARSKIFSELVVIYFITSISLSFIYLLVVFYHPYFNVNRDMYIGASLMILLGFFYIEWLYTGLEQFRSIALRSVLFKIIGLILLYVFIKQRSDFINYLYIMMFSYLGNNILSCFLIRGKVKFTLTHLQLRKHIVPLLLILSTTLASGMYTIMDTVLLGFLSSKAMVGIYIAADKLCNVTLPFVTSMGAILIPKMAKYFADDQTADIQKTLNQNFSFLMFFAVPVACMLALLAPEFITLFSGNEFLPAVGSMRVLSLLPLVIGMGHMFLYMILVPAGKNKEMLFCVLGGVAVFLILNFLLVPRLNALGASIANICTEIVVTAFYFYYIKKYFSFSYQWQLFFKAILSALIFVPVILLLRTLLLPAFIMLMLSSGICALLYIGIQFYVLKNTFVIDIFDFVRSKFKTSEQV